jgi:transcriptional regulator with XRE-family HTH domain
MMTAVQERPMPTRTHEQTWLGQNIASLRQHTYLTQRQLAEKAGISLGLLQKLEEGWTDNPRLSTLRRLAAALGVSISQLVGDETADPVTQSAG